MAAKPRVLLLGSEGQLGRELKHTLAEEFELVTSSRNQGNHPCDLSDLDQVADMLRKVQPDHIVNAAAYTAVDQAESERDQAFLLNRDLPKLLAEPMAECGGLLTHYSTDYVFSGTGNRPYREDDPTDPVNAYGESKLAGEKAIQETDCQHLIFRTAWVYGRHGRNFVKTIVRLAAERDSLSVVDDQLGRPTCAADLAELSIAAFAQAQTNSISGIFHLTANGEAVSWCGFANSFLAWKQAQEPGVALAKPSPVPSTEFPTPAKRPAYSVMSNQLFEERFGLKVPTWQDQLNEALPSFAWN